MGENVDLQLVLKRVDAVLAGQDEFRAEINALRETVDAQSATLIGVRRELRNLQNDFSIFQSAIDDHSRRLAALEQRNQPPPAHV